MRPGRLRIGESEYLEYTRLAQWIEHLATNQGFVGVRVPHRVPRTFWTKFENVVRIIFIFSRRERYFMDISIFTKYDVPQRTEKFRTTLITLRGHQCECCKLTTWLEQPINLELHHRDGDKSNNELDNLQLLCPNCHSYTDNYGSKNKNHQDISDDELLMALQNSPTIRQALLSLGMSDAGANYNRARALMNKYNITLNHNYQEKENFCVDCGKSIYPGSTRCNQCEAKTRQSVVVSREQLKTLIRTTSFTQIGKKYGVSDNAVRKWCDNYKLPRRVSEIKQYSDEEWSKV